LYGRPNGYGLMQLDNPAATEKQLWNWQANIDGGSNLYFTEKKPGAFNYLQKHHNYNQEQYYKSAFQRYNGGNLYIWNKDDSWVLNEELDKETRLINGSYITKYYGEFVWDQYQLLNP
jgi:hypothetical protein